MPPILLHGDDQSLSTGLFQFIQKNIAIPSLLSNIQTNNIKMNELLNAIATGNPKANIWSDPNCYLYLLHLITTSKIPFRHGISAYVYLTTLIQFTTKQPIKEMDKDTKLICDVNVDVLSIDNKLTEAGEKFLKSIHERLLLAGYCLSYTRLVKFALTLPPVEQWLIKIPYMDSYIHKNLHPRDLLLHVLLGNIPFCRYEKTQMGQGYCWIPSSSMIYYVLQKISPAPIQMRPHFGSIGVEMLKKMHANNIHPVSLYGLHVHSNPKDADQYRCGPLLMWLHDVGHTFWGSMLLPSERQIIFETFLPPLESILDIAKQYQDKELITKVEATILNTVSFDLSDIRQFTEQRLTPYLHRAFGNDNRLNNTLYPPGRLEFQKIGFAAEDRFYFLLLQMHYELKPSLQKQFWEGILQLIYPSENQRAPQIINAIIQLAKFAANLPIETLSFLKLDEEDCNEWLTIIDSSKSSDDVWKAIFKQEKNDQFLQLISQGHMLFFPPFLPLSDKTRSSFKKSLEDRKNQLNALPTPTISQTSAASLRR